MQRSQTPNRKAARASASTPETTRGFLRYPGSNGKHFGTKASPLSRDKHSQGVFSRTRYGDRFSPASRVLKMSQKQSPMKVKITAADRLALKRKAMATLTAAKKTEKSHRASKMFKKAMSEGELMKRKVKESWESEIDTDVDIDVVASDISDSENIDVVNTDVDSIVDNDDKDSHACVVDHDMRLCGSCEMKPNVNVNSCECFGCFDTMIDYPFECSSQFKHDVNNNTEAVAKMMLEFDSSLNYNYTKTLTPEAEIFSMNDSCDSNIDVENISMGNDAFGIRVTDDVLNPLEKTFGAIVKGEEKAAVEPDQILESIAKTSVCTGNREPFNPGNILESLITGSKIPITEQKTDTAFVSSLFNPLSSDLDESIDITVLEEVSLDDSIDLDELLNYNDTEELGLIDPEAIKELVSESTSKWQLDNLSARGEPDLNNNRLDDKKKCCTEAKMGLGYKETIKQTDINNNSMFKPAFNTSPKPLFGGIIELASGITPKIKPAVSDPTVITQDHAYSKMKKPVHFNLRSRTLKCKEVQSLFTGSQSLSVVKSFNRLNCDPVKEINTDHQSKSKAVSVSYEKETVAMINNHRQEMMQQNFNGLEKPILRDKEADIDLTSANTSEELKIGKHTQTLHTAELLDCKRDEESFKEHETHGLVRSVSYGNQNDNTLGNTALGKTKSSSEDSFKSVNAKILAERNNDGLRVEPELSCIRELRGRKVIQVVYFIQDCLLFSVREFFVVLF